MLNPFVVKKWAAFIIVGFLSVIGFFVGLKYYNLLMGLAAFMGCLIVAAIIANVMIRNPFTDMLEGRGLLVIDINSTGIIRPFVFGISPPYIRGVKDGRVKEDVFNRSGVFNFKTPVAAQKKAEYITEGEKEGGIKIELSEDDYNKARFGMFQYPVLLYNSQLDSLVTKDFIAVTEKETYAEHTILYLNHKINELTTVMRDFGRYVVELTKPKANWLQSKLFWIIIIIAALLLGALFLPKIVGLMGGAVESASGAVSSATGAASSGTSGIIQPR